MFSVHGIGIVKAESSVAPPGRSWESIDNVATVNKFLPLYFKFPSIVVVTILFPVTPCEPINNKRV